MLWKGQNPNERKQKLTALMTMKENLAIQSSNLYVGKLSEGD